MKRHNILLIFLLALFFRLFVVLFLNTQFISQDAREFYQIAANLVNNNGYSLDIEEPYGISLYREPGFPVFLATFLKARQVVGYQVNTLNEHQFFYHLDDDTVHNMPEIKYLKIVHAFIDSFTVVLFVMLASLVITSKKQLLIYGIAFALFLPSAYYTTTLMRETWLTFLCAAFALFFARYLLRNKKTDLLLFTLFFGLMAITFQVMLIFGASIVIYLLFYRRFQVAIRDSSFVAFGVVLLSLPWLLFAYQTYPDIKIVKSWGTSLTHEKMQFVNVHRKLAAVGLISQDSLNQVYASEFANSTREAFDKSFSGEYSVRIAEINQTLDAHSMLVGNYKRDKSKDRIMDYATAFIRPFSLKGIADREINDRTNVYSPAWLAYLFLAIALALGAISFAGFTLNLRRLSPILIVFYTLFAIIFLIGSHRRVSPLHGYMVLFLVLQLMAVYQFLKEKFLSKAKISAA